MNYIRPLVLLLSMFLLAKVGLAAGMFIYPNKGQSQDQQEKDKYECQTWATQQTGYDPMNSGSAPPTQQTQTPGAFGGAARGAALGAVGGAIGGDAGKGAAIGAATGALFGGMRRRDEQRQDQQTQANYQAQKSANRSEWDRALKACLSGRGYTVQ